MYVPGGPMYACRPGSRKVRPVLRRLTVPMSGAAAAVGATVLCLVLAAIGEDRASWLSLTVFACLAAAVGVCSRPAAAPVVALSSWLLFDGFVAHRYGELGWSGPSVELPRLAILAAAALLASLPGTLPRRRIRAATLRLASPQEGTHTRAGDR